MVEAPPLKPQSRTFGDDPEFAGPPKSRGGHMGIWWCVALCFVAAGALIAVRGDLLHRFRVKPVMLIQAQSPVEAHKQKYLSARAQGQLDDLRFHQNALLKLGFLEQKIFMISNRSASKVQLNMDGMDAKNLQFATIEPRTANRLSIIAVKEDMPFWEELVRLADVKE